MVVNMDLNSQNIKNRLMKIKSIKKRCDRCEELFEIPLLKKCPAREILLLYYPCPHCGYFKLPNTNNNRTGRCRECLMPFGIVDHKSKGFCARCYMRYLREKAT